MRHHNDGDNTQVSGVETWLSISVDRCFCLCLCQEKPKAVSNGKAQVEDDDSDSEESSEEEEVRFFPLVLFHYSVGRGIILRSCFPDNHQCSVKTTMPSALIFVLSRVRRTTLLCVLL